MTNFQPYSRIIIAISFLSIVTVFGIINSRVIFDTIAVDDSDLLMAVETPDGGAGIEPVSASEQPIAPDAAEPLIIAEAENGEVPVEGILESPTEPLSDPMPVPEVVSPDEPVAVEPVSMDPIGTEAEPAIDPTETQITAEEVIVPLVTEAPVGDAVPVDENKNVKSTSQEMAEQKIKNKKNPPMTRNIRFMKDNDCASEIISTKQLIEAALDNEVFVCGQIFDDVGGETLHDSSVFTVTLFDSNGTTDDCMESDSNCYKKSGTDIAVGNCQENVCDFSALFSEVKYFANSSAWKVAVAVAEEKAVDENANVNEELMIDSLLAVDVTPHVDFRNVSLGEVSDEVKLTFMNTGNLAVDVEKADGGSMPCAHGVIPAENIRYSLVPGFNYDEGIPFSEAIQLINLNLAQRTSLDTPMAVDVYMRIKIPPTGIGGTCSNVLTFNAVADQ